MPNADQERPEKKDAEKEKRPFIEFEVRPSVVQFLREQQDVAAKWPSLSTSLADAPKLTLLAEAVREWRASMPMVNAELAKLLTNASALKHSQTFMPIPDLPRVAPEFVEMVRKVQKINEVLAESPGVKAMAAITAKSREILNAIVTLSGLDTIDIEPLQEYLKARPWPTVQAVQFEGLGLDVANIDLERLSSTPSESSPALLLEESGRVKRIITDIFKDDKTLLRLEPYAFEEVVAELLRSQGFNVELTKRTRDGGYDLIAISKQSGFPLKFLVECKRYTKERVGIDIVRSLLYVVQQEQANKGIIATTSYFSRDVKEHQKNLHPYLLDLRDKNDILVWIRQYGESILHLQPRNA